MQTRCEAILRTHPKARFAHELHLACIQAEEEKKEKEMKKAARNGVAAAAAVGLVAGVASLLMKK